MVSYCYLRLKFCIIKNQEFDNSKKKETLDHDFSNHYKKSFMKTYEENRIKHKIIIRK